MTVKKRWILACAGVAVASVAGARLLSATAQVISDPLGATCVATSGENCSAQYVAVSNGGAASTTSPTRSVSITTTGPATAQHGEAISLEGAASAVSGGEVVSVTGPAYCGGWTISTTGTASCAVSNEAVISGTGNASSAASIATVSGTGNASNGADQSQAVGSDIGFTGLNSEFAISGTGCASGGFLLTLVVSGNCDASSWWWECYTCPKYDGWSAINLGHGCAQGGDILNVAIWGCANAAYNACPFGSTTAISVFGTATTCGANGGDDVAIGGAGASGSTAAAISGPASAYGGPVAASGAGPASGGVVAVSTSTDNTKGNGATGNNYASGSELAVSLTGSAHACGGPYPVAFSGGALLANPGANGDACPPTIP